MKGFHLRGMLVKHSLGKVNESRKLNMEMAQILKPAF